MRGEDAHFDRLLSQHQARQDEMHHVSSLNQLTGVLAELVNLNEEVAEALRDGDITLEEAQVHLRSTAAEFRAKGYMVEAAQNFEAIDDLCEEMEVFVGQMPSDPEQLALWARDFSARADAEYSTVMRQIADEEEYVSRRGRGR